MRYKSLLSLILLLFCNACNKEEIIDVSQTPELIRVIDSEFKRLQMPGMAYAAVKEDSIVTMGGMGHANTEKKLDFTAQTRLQMASVSKTVVAVSIMQLVEKGLLKLDDDINRHLPFEVINPHRPSIPITIKMLLTHRSSIRDADFLFTTLYTYGFKDHPEDLMDFARNYLTPKGKYYSKTNFSAAPPGEAWRYSNVGAGLLACVVEYLSGVDFNAYCKTHIFSVLQMGSTSWRYSESPQGEVAVPYADNNYRKPTSPYFSYPNYPSGHLIGTVEDMSKFMMALMAGGTLKNAQILSPHAVDLILRTYTSDIYLPSPPESVYSTGPHLESQGLLFLKGELGCFTLWGHTGDDAGVSTEMYFDIERKVGYIMFNNRSWAHSPTLGKALLKYAQSH